MLGLAFFSHEGGQAPEQVALGFCQISIPGNTQNKIKIEKSYLN